MSDEVELAERGSTGGRIVAAALVAAGIAVGGWLAGDGLVRAHSAERSVTMRGLAERNVTADLATWNLAYSATGTDLASVQAEADRSTQAILDLLHRSGFADDEIQIAGANVSQYRNNGELNVTVNQRLQLRTAKVAQAQRAFARQASLIRQGVALDSGSSIVYSFTKLNGIKPAMIAAATRDARAGAEQFAKDSGTSVGAIKSATQGYFSIQPRDGEGGDTPASASPYQKVRVVTTIDFYLG